MDTTAPSAILVSQSLRTLVEEGSIGAVKPVLGDQIQPSSLDLRLGARIWQLQCSFLPGREGVTKKLSGHRVAGINLCIEATVTHFHNNIDRAKLPRVNVESQPIVARRDIGRQTLT